MDETGKSRTQKKNEDKALEKTGKQLMALSSEQLDQLDLPEELDDAIATARITQKHGARRRQVKYIRTLLRQIDSDPIQQILENLQFDDLQKTLSFQKIEKWRDELREGNEQIVEEILAACPKGDRQLLLKLARNARNEYKEARDKKSSIKASRMLFRYLREIS